MIISRSILLCGLLYVVGTLASVLDARGELDIRKGGNGAGAGEVAGRNRVLRGRY